MKRGTPTIPRAEIQHELENIRSGWHYVIASAQAPLVEGIEQYMEGLFVFWEMNSAFVEGQAAFAQAAAALQAMSGQPERRTLILGRICWRGRAVLFPAGSLRGGP